LQGHLLALVKQVGLLTRFTKSKIWKNKLECKTIESIMIEILINKRKWLISGLYRPQTQSINDNNFNKDFIDTFDKISTWSKFLKLLYSTNFLFILGIVPLI
jgi:hypothetical protein